MNNWKDVPDEAYTSNERCASKVTGTMKRSFVAELP